MEFLQVISWRLKLPGFGDWEPGVQALLDEPAEREARVTIEKFSKIHARAAERHGGEAALASLMPDIRSQRSLAATRDDR